MIIDDTKSTEKESAILYKQLRVEEVTVYWKRDNKCQKSGPGNREGKTKKVYIT